MNGKPVIRTPITDAIILALNKSAKPIAIKILMPKNGLKLVQTPKANPNAISCGESFKCFNLLT